MSGLDEVADSTDWFNTPLSGLAPLESGLRCQVCKDFFTTPMMTSCSHTFCSLCIRRYLSQEGKCPACRDSDQEIKLRRNWAVEELVAHFTQSRDQILAFARKPAPTETNESERPKKRRRIEPPTKETGRRSTRSQSRRMAASQEAPSTQEEVADSDEEGSIYRDEGQTQTKPHNNKQEPHDGLVTCPCCTRRMKETLINAHLDRCVQGLPASPDPPPPTQTATNSASLAFAQRTKSPVTVAQKDRLPSINYALYTDTSLRKKLKDLGIPNQGSKELMRKRHIEWMNLWNANCDSSKPKTKRELLKELDTWEKTLGRQIERNTTGTSSGVMVKEFDRDGWVKSQKGEFDDLIKRAREKRKAAVASENKDGNKDTSMPDTNGEVQQNDVSDDPQPVSEQPIEEAEPSSHPLSKGEEPSHHDEQVGDDADMPVTNGVPATPEKGRNVMDADTGAAIDLTSSPAAACQHTPGRQRSRFFT